MDYAAAPVQPLVQGLLTVDPISLVPTFQGRGVSSVTRPSIGVYNLNLDVGLPGNAGELAATSPTTLPAADIRSMITMRGSPTNPILAFSTSVTDYTVDYINPGPDGGIRTIQLVFQTWAQSPVDPTGNDAAGVEIAVFRGV
jgi:hypothetical protein